MTSTATSRPARFGKLLAPQLVGLGLCGLALAGFPLLLAALYHGLRGLLVDPYRSQAAALLRLALAEQNGFALFAVADGVLGVSFFALWVLYRERSLALAAAWAAAISLTGFGACSIYLVRALTECSGDWQRFWMGSRAPPAVMHDKEQ